MATAMAIAIAALAWAPADAQARYAPQARVSVQCSISGIDTGAWEAGILRLSTQCNAEHYRIRLLSGGTEIALLAAGPATPGAAIRLRDGHLLVSQDRPGTREIEIRLDQPVALTGALSIQIEAL